jgi:hypothetical protein
MTLEEFIKKHKADLEKFQNEWLAQVSDANLDFPEWMDYFWGWSEQEWYKENRE